MSLEVEETGPVERRLRIEVPTVEVDAVFDEVFRSFGRDARIPGFRKGKVPRSVLERHFGDVARGDVLRRLVGESLSRAIDEGGLEVIGEPRIETGEHPRQGTPFSYEVQLEIRPEIALAQVRGLAVRRPLLPEPEEDPVEAHLEQLRAACGRLVEERPGSVAARGHWAVIDFDGSVDGETFPGGSGRETTVEIGGDRGIPGFTEQLEGMAPGQERDFEIELPEGFPGGRAGRTACFHVKLLELKRRELPELDDELAKDASEFATLDELRQDLRRRVEEGRRAEEKHLLREAVIDALVEANPFPVPAGLVERQLEVQLARAASQFEGRLPEDRLGEMIERLRDEWRPRAERDVRVAFLIPEIARAESIEVTPEEIEGHLRQRAEQEGKSPGALRRSYREKGLLEALERSLLEQRVVEFVVAEATLSET